MSYPNLTLVKLWNVATGETENVSYQADGSLTDFAAGAPLVSATGEKVAYATTNWLMVPGVAKPEAGVFVADMGLR
jgi:fructose-1,6-bisphosphatase/inositol monophosphatase family enzyme